MAHNTIMDNNVNKYKPMLNHIFIKVINKIYNNNTTLNTSFNWYNNN